MAYLFCRRLHRQHSLASALIRASNAEVHAGMQLWLRRHDSMRCHRGAISA